MSTKQPIKHIPVRGDVEETFWEQSATDPNIQWEVTRAGDVFNCSCPAGIRKDCRHRRIIRNKINNITWKGVENSSYPKNTEKK